MKPPETTTVDLMRAVADMVEAELAFVDPKPADVATALRERADRLEGYLSGRGGPVLKHMRAINAPAATPKEPR